MLAIAALVLALLAPAPHLQLFGTRPIRVHGTGFRPGERVRVTVDADTEFRHARVTAGRHGAFSVRMRALGNGNCTPFTVTAVGASGDRGFTRRPCMD